MNTLFDIYEYFNSHDIAEHCRNVNYKFSATETAYIVWYSNHHTLADKHHMWQKIIDTMPDELFHPNWDFNGHTLHSFLRTYIQLQNEFIEDFCKTKDKYVYTYSSLYRYDVQYSPDDIFYDSYEACLHDLKVNVIDDDDYNEISKVKINRHRLYSSHISFQEAKETDSVIFDKQLCPIEIEVSNYETDGDGKFLGPSYGFYEMWVAIPTPFKKGDIVADVDVYDSRTKKHTPFILERIPYWRENADNGDDCEEQIEHLMNIVVDWTDMQEGVYLQGDDGEIYWDHAFHYLNLEYYREELLGTEKFLLAVSSAMQGKITTEELLRSHNIILMEQYATEMRKYFGENQKRMRLCGIIAEDTCIGLASLG